MLPLDLPLSVPLPLAAGRGAGRRSTPRPLGERLLDWRGGVVFLGSERSWRRPAEGLTGRVSSTAIYASSFWFASAFPEASAAEAGTTLTDWKGEAGAAAGDAPDERHGLLQMMGARSGLGMARLRVPRCSLARLALGGKGFELGVLVLALAGQLSLVG